MMGLREATTMALRSGGMELLGAPRRLVGLLTDLIDTDSAEARVLYSGCDERFCAFLSDAARTGTSQAFSDAAYRASDYLSSHYALDANAAQQVAWQIACGVADVLGIAMPAWGTQPQAPQVVSSTPLPQVSEPPQPAYVPQTQVPAQAVVPVQDTYSQTPPHTPGTYVPTPPAQVQTPVTPPSGGSRGGAGTPPAKSNGVLVGALVGVLALALVLVLVGTGIVGGGKKSGMTRTAPQVQSSVSGADGSGTGDESVTGNDAYETVSDQGGSLGDLLDGQDATSGSINGLSYELNVTQDAKFGEVRVMFVHNDSDQNLRVAHQNGSVYIPSIAPGDDGFFLMPADGVLTEVLSVTTTSEWVPWDYCEWSVDASEGENAVFTLTNDAGSVLSFEGFFYFVSGTVESYSYMGENWFYEDGSEVSTIDTGYNTFTYYGANTTSLLANNYDLYINGVKIRKR